MGLNIDFQKLFETGNPHLYFGGDSVVFWGPLAWTMIFGLTFATFLTLLLVPAMYLMSERLKRKYIMVLNHYQLPMILMYVPFAVLGLRGLLRIQNIQIDYGDLDS